VAVFGLFLMLLTPDIAPYLIPLLLLLSLFPRYRYPLVLIGTLASALLGLTLFNSQRDASLPAYLGLGHAWDMFILLGVIFALSILFYRLALAGRFGFLRGFSALAPVALLLATGLVLSYVPMLPVYKAAGWALFFVWSKYVWFQAYSIHEARLQEHSPTMRQLAVYQPYWYPSMLPLHKGASFLGRIECRDAESLAVCQLKALKLIMWAAVLNVVLVLAKGFFYGEGLDVSKSFLIQWQAGGLGLFFNGEYLATLWQRDVIAWFAPLDITLTNMAQGAEPPVAGGAMAASIFYLMMYVCNLAVNSHVGIAVLRMSGFYALRNVYRPFEAKSIADFFGRYNYYYRELLVTIFFYPTFFQCFKKHPRLRQFFAIFAAAAIGNTLFHLFYRFEYIVQVGIFEAALSFHTFAVYGVILTVGIFMSHLNKVKPRNPSIWKKGWTLFVILVFYSIATIFADEGYHSIGVNIQFLLAVFGVRS
jgi:hypothetical protein